ncbi:MAG: hypothetical protein GMKNLPBB_03231 [Myxococcota bacterium]|nr:hypothetical protein [Myxococcota bacterium]
MMRTKPSRIIQFMMAMALAVPQQAYCAAADAPGAGAVRVSRDDAETIVQVDGSAEPVYTVFKLSNPDRIVVDLNGAFASGIEAPQAFPAGIVKDMTAIRYRDGDKNIMRLIFVVENGASYRLKANGKTLSVIFSTGFSSVDDRLKAARELVSNNSSAPATRSSLAAPPAAVAKKEAPAPAPAVREEKETAPPSIPSKVSSAPAAPAKPSVVEGVTVETKPASCLVTIHGAGELAAPETQQVENPSRLVIDVPNSRKGKGLKEMPINNGWIKQVRFGAHESKVRVVLDLADNTPLKAEPKPGKPGETSVVLTRAPAAKPEPPAVAAAPRAEPAASKAETAPAAAKPVETKPAPAEAPAKMAQVDNIRFQRKDGKSSVIIETGGKPEYRVLQGNRKFVLELTGVSLPGRLEQALDTSAFGGPVQMVTSYTYAGTGAVRIAATLNGKVTPQVVPFDKGVRFEMEEERGASELPPMASVSKGEPGRTAAYSTTVESVSHSSAVAQAGKPEEKITIDTKNMDIRSFLNLIADRVGINIIAADDVRGVVSVKLRDVPWNIALKQILAAKGYGIQERPEANLIRIAPLDVLNKEEELKQQKELTSKLKQPLSIHLIPVNYALAAEISPLLSQVKSQVGTITVDPRTNVLIIQDLKENLIKAEKLVRKLDLETPQILIESRIVEANTNQSRSLGIQWGGGVHMSPRTGNSTGLVFPNTVGIFGGADDPQTLNPNSGTASPGDFVVNLPAPVGAGSGGALGFIFGSASGNEQLNLRLSAAEASGEVRIVSSPRITTMDNKEAKINQGVAIPISVVSAAGVNTRFVNADLSLTVTPHVTADRSILLKLVVTKAEPDFSRRGASGDPTIVRQNAQTQMLIKDGESAVIGGIFVRRSASSRAGVPFLSKIPVLGWLFQNSQNTDERSELLIFITPRIVSSSDITLATTTGGTSSSSSAR